MNGLICRMGLAFMEFISSMGGFHQIQTRADVNTLSSSALRMKMSGEME